MVAFLQDLWRFAVVSVDGYFTFQANDVFMHRRVVVRGRRSERGQFHEPNQDGTVFQQNRMAGHFALRQGR